MCFYSDRICCYSMATHSEIDQKFLEDSFVLRTTEVHEYHLQCVHHDKGQNDKANTPVFLSERLLQAYGKIGTASQQWCLFRLQPFLMGHHIPPGSRNWHVFLLCRETADIVMAAKLRKDELPYLELLVHAFLTKITEVFGNVLTPKCHCLINFPRNILIYGPIYSHWCMRFEGKHQY